MTCDYPDDVRKVKVLYIYGTIIRLCTVEIKAAYIFLEEDRFVLKEAGVCE